MQQYTLDPAQFAKIKKKILARFVPIMAIVMITLAITQSYNPKTGQFDFFPFLIIIPVFSAIAGYGLYQVFSKQKKLFDSFQITVHDNLIKREQWNTPTMDIYVNDITSMKKTADNHIIIKGKKPQDVIYVPPQVQNYDELERKLEEFMLIVPATKKTLLQRFAWLIGVAVIALMITSLSSINAIVAALCALPVIGTLIYYFFWIMRNKSIDNRTKRGAWWVWIVIILLTVSTTLKFTYFQWY